MTETRICPFCGKEILAVAKKCKHCGKWLDDKSEEFVCCPTCGEKVKKGTTICPHCNEPMDGIDKGQTVSEKQDLLANSSEFQEQPKHGFTKKSTSKNIVWVASAIFGILVIVSVSKACGDSLSKESPQSHTSPNQNIDESSTSYSAYTNSDTYDTDEKEKDISRKHTLIGKADGYIYYLKGNKGQYEPYLFYQSLYDNSEKSYNFTQFYDGSMQINDFALNDGNITLIVEELDRNSTGFLEATMVINFRPSERNWLDITQGGCVKGEFNTSKDKVTLTFGTIANPDAEFTYEYKYTYGTEVISLRGTIEPAKSISAQNVDDAYQQQGSAGNISSNTIWERGYLNNEFGEIMQNCPFVYGEIVKGDEFFSFKVSNCEGIIVGYHRQFDPCGLSEASKLAIKAHNGQIFTFNFVVRNTDLQITDQQQVTQFVNLLVQGHFIMSVGFPSGNAYILKVNDETCDLQEVWQSFN